MAATRFGKLSGAAALAIALAGLATPAFAQDDEGRDGREAREAPGNIGGGGGERQERAAWRASREAAPQRDGGRSSRRAEAPQAAPAAAAAPVAAPAQARSWRGGDEGGRGDSARGEGRRWGTQSAPAGTYGRDWSTGRVERPAPAEAAAAAAPAVPERARDGRRDGSWSGRDRGSVDGTRGTTYRDSGRDRRDGSGWRGSDGDRRDSSTWSGRTGSRDGYRDGDRREGAAWQGGTSNRRSGYSGGNHRRWDRHDWRRDRRYDWNSYRRYNRSVFNIGIYYSPYRNYSYRRLSTGFFLNSLFYSNRYWINDPWRYRLPEVYGPYRWVRYYDDALLVDIYSGEVVDVIHNFFW